MTCGNPIKIRSEVLDTSTDRHGERLKFMYKKCNPLNKLPFCLFDFSNIKYKLK